VTTFHQLIQYVLDDTLGVSLTAFRPELALCATIVALLLSRMVASSRKNLAFYVMLAGAAAALYFAAPWRLSDAPAAAHPAPIFTGLLVYDAFSIYMRALLVSFLILFTLLTRLTGMPHRDDATDFYVLIAGATLGMCLMVSANHMLIVFLGIEMASVPSYALAGMLRDRRPSSEAALKFAIYGAGAAGIMLYGISLLVGVLGSAHLPTMAAQLAALLQHGAGADRYMALVLGSLMVMVGVAFKLSAVPFHFWAPDVFEGAPAEVAAFLSIASKAAALGLLVRLAMGLCATANPLDMAALEPARQFTAGLVALLAVVTCTFGNLAAYGQTNMKRLLAYSTIAHAGYMMMPVAAAVALAGQHPDQSRTAIAALAFYIGLYLFMNLGAFSGVAFLRNVIHSEAIDDYAGLIHKSPGLALCLSIILFSLVGLPPLAGFMGKFTIFASLFDARLLTVLVIGGLNTVLSLFYYLRVVKVMTLSAEPALRPAPVIAMASVPGLYCLMVTAPVVILGVWWNGLFTWAQAAATSFLG
jgi:NADH-quinone oxidoreductase subunit N